MLTRAELHGPRPCPLDYGNPILLFAEIKLTHFIFESSQFHVHSPVIQLWVQCPDGADRHEQTPSCDQMAWAASSVMGAAILFSTCAPFALTGEVAGPPSIETGDVWVDRLSSGDREYRVLSVTANGVLYTMWGAQERSDSQWNPIVTSSLTESKDPPLIYARPLSMFPSR
jgi:hypothetical protein